MTNRTTASLAATTDGALAPRACWFQRSRWVLRAMIAGLAVVQVLVQVQPLAAQKAPDADPAAVAAAQELMHAAGATRQFEAVIPSLVQQMTAIFVQQQPAHERVIRQAFAGVALRMTERKNELIVEIAKLYAQQFSLAELRELTQFFADGVGKRFVDKQLVILPQSMAIGQQWGARIGAEVDAEMRKELRKRGVPI
ncbi:MAG: DUF2059 domain-containing protein [Hyphomicrobiaceae bacterium]